MDKLAAMRTFVEIVDRGSLTAAGAALGRSLPTVVRTLAGLEDALGVVLLRRTTRRMALTDEGRLYLDRCRRLLADLAEAEELVRSDRAELRGPLRVTAPVLFGQRHLTRPALAFARAHPAVHLELRLLDRVVDLLEEGIDAAVRIGPLEDSSLISAPLGRMRRVVVASPDWLDAQGAPPGSPADLAGRPAVCFTGLAPGRLWRFAESGRAESVAISPVFTTNQALTAVDACVGGLGFGQFLAYQVAPAVRAGELVCVLEEFEPPPVPVHLLFSEARLASARLRAFVDHLKGEVAGSLDGLLGA